MQAYLGLRQRFANRAGRCDRQGAKWRAPAHQPLALLPLRLTLASYLCHRRRFRVQQCADRGLEGIGIDFDGFVASILNRCDVGALGWPEKFN